MNELKQLEEIAKIETAREVLPHILLFADDDHKIEEYSKEYLRILLKNDVFTRDFVKTDQAYLDLTFPPAHVTGEVFAKFFRSPEVKAKVRNHFYGVFVCRMKHWTAEDLNHTYFKKLMEYASENTNFMRFVFVIPCSETDTDLKEKLFTNLNIHTVYTKLPDVLDSEVYMKKQLMKQGVFVDEESEKRLHELVEKVVDNEMFKGYKTMDLVVQQLSLELLLNEEERSAPDVYSRVMNKLVKEAKKRRIGF